MDNKFIELAAPGVRALHPYQPGKPLAELEREYGIHNAVKLASNENPLGPSPSAIAAASRALQDLARYPEGSGYLLTGRLAKKHRLSSQCVTLGNGSNDVLDLVARVFLTPDHNAVYSQYAFAVYPIVVQATGAQGRVAAAHDGSHGPAYGHDLAAMNQLVGSNTRLVFIANPNNPTGTWLDPDELQAFIAGLPGHVMVVVDEAYAPFTDASFMQQLPNHDNLLVLRTVSKMGLAGLRLGLLAGAPEWLEQIDKTRLPYNIGSLNQLTGSFAMQHKSVFDEQAGKIREARAALLAGLQAMDSLTVFPSEANFILFRVPPARADAIYDGLQEAGILIKNLHGSTDALRDCLRVTVGLPEENEAFLAALAQLLS